MTATQIYRGIALAAGATLGALGGTLVVEKLASEPQRFTLACSAGDVPTLNVFDVTEAIATESGLLAVRSADGATWYYPPMPGEACALTPAE